MAIIHKDGLSTAVRIRLEVEGMVLRVSQVGENSLILRDVSQMWATDDAQVVISIDGEEMIYPIVLPNGINDRVVRFVDGSSCRLKPVHGTDCTHGSGEPF